MVPAGYEVVRELGRGGMGVVLEARELATGRRVALKQLHPGAALDAELRARFMVEAHATARLSHPHLIRVHAVLEAGPTIVMELVEGESLQRRLEREGPLASEEALRLTEALAEALDHAHAQGVLHRDLKPANVLVDRQGHPRLADFGLARLVTSAAPLTATGEILGTPGFMAPEQVAGKPVDARTDVYGLGALLFALLTGRPPFQREGQIALLAAVLREEPPPPSRVRPGIPAAVDDLALACLAKDPASRPADMRALLDALARARAGIRARRRKRLPLGWLAVPCAAVAPLLAWRWAGSSAEPSPRAPVVASDPVPAAPATTQGAASPVATPSSSEAGAVEGWFADPQLGAQYRRYQQAQREVDAGDVPKALSTVEEGLKAPRPIFELFVLHADLLARSGASRERALETLGRGIGLHPEQPTLRAERIERLRSQPRREDLAPLLEDHLVLAGRGGVGAPQHLLEAAYLAEQLQDLPRMLEILLQGAERWPGNAKIIAPASMRLASRGQPDDLRRAREMVDRLLGIERTPVGLTALAVVLSLARDTDGALAAALEASDLDPDSPFLHYECAVKAFAAGQPQLGRERLARTVQLASGNAALLIAVGSQYEHQGDREAAQRVYGRALELDPAHPDVRSRLEALRSGKE